MLRRAPAAAALLALLLTTGCGGDDDDSTTPAPTYTAPTYTAPPTSLDPALVAALTRPPPTSQSVAADLTQFGVAGVEPTDVDALAADLCRSGFNGGVVVQALRARLTDTSALLLVPTSDLLDLAGNPARCTAAPSAQQREDYSSTLVSYLIPSLSGRPPAPVLPVSSETQQQFCQILEAGSDFISGIIDEILQLASRNRVKGGDLLAFTVDVAAMSCSRLLPVAKDALEQYSLSGS